ncbi:cupin domain-containing protein [Salibacterium aidingense]|uniref:cupin domain-containing protein n=1 Tax=Salibacterium aidingense TaxID=384933 RepID=UPI003BD5EFC5
MYYCMYPYPYFVNIPTFHYGIQPVQETFSPERGYRPQPIQDTKEWKDYGSNPYVVNINEASKQNETFRTVIWTGDHLQVTVMSIPPGKDIGLEIHPDVDQFLRIEDGHGLVQIGDTEDHLYFQRKVFDDDAIMVPAGKWHNLVNTGSKPLKLYTIYAPPEHPFGTVHPTKEDATIAGHHPNP